MPDPSRLAISTVLALALAGCANLPFGQGKHLAAMSVGVDLAAARTMISAYRRSHGLTAVVLDPVLEGVAERQAMAMASADHMSHTVDGSLMARLDGARAPNGAAIENVSAGYETLAAAIAGWRHSPPHNANLLNPRMRRMGIGAADAPASRYKIYWSLVMTD